LYNENSETPTTPAIPTTTPAAHNTSTTELCVYDKPAANKKTACVPGMFIVFEDGLLKVDEH
ncbi:MAG: hypothetical protein LBJ59_07775, partial [Zoogloeaceae bacterium]|nr:hypothetical protein [Zoogloeaceae bacterium]